jgi:uncharacterized protein
MTSRVFDHAFVWRMTSRQLTDAASLLAYSAARRFGPIGTVIAIERGGVQPARAIASQLSACLLTIRAQHNPTSDLYVEATGRVTCTVSGIKPGAINGQALVVDDICGTGATLHAVTSILGELAGPDTRLHTATLCRNAGASSRPELTVWDDLREWVIFPWEPAPPAGITIRILPEPRQAHAQ